MGPPVGVPKLLETETDVPLFSDEEDNEQDDLSRALLTDQNRACDAVRKQFGSRFEFLQLLHGGERTITLKFHDRELQRLVAMKWLRTDDSDGYEFAQSCRDASRLGDLPNFLSIYDARLEDAGERILVLQ